MAQMCLRTGELDLDLQGQIALKTSKFCVIPCECNNFEPFGILTLTFKVKLGLETLKCFSLTFIKHSTFFNLNFQLELFIKHLNFSDGFKNW